MRSWKKLWKEELDEIAPDLRDDVKNAPIRGAVNVNANGGNTAALAADRRRSLIAVIAVFTALVVCAVVLCVCLIKPSKPNARFMFALEINPTVTLSTDENGVVTGVMSSNADADVLLATDNAVSELKGKDMTTAMTYLADRAARLGFIDLDEKNSAVRISGYGSDALLAKAQTALEDYFMEKGAFVAVVAVGVSKDEFAARSGISPDLSASDAAEFIDKSSVSYCVRAAEGAGLERVRSLYDELIVKDKLFAQISDSLSQNIERLTKNADDINALFLLYTEILDHDDNPLKPWGDYWTVKQLFGDSFVGEFGQLMKQMESALAQYKADYGVDISSAASLKAAFTGYINLPIQELVAILQNISYEKFKDISAEITEIMKITGLITDGVSDLLQAPDSLEDYLQRTSAVFTAENKKRTDEFEQIYNKFRQPVEQKDYQAYIDGIAERYGSLDAFWNSLKR